MAIFFITGNNNKFAEAKQIISDLEQLALDLPEIQNTDPQEIIKSKVAEAQQRCRETFVVEDGSLFLDCIPGLPGPLVKWFFKTLGNDGIYNLAKKFGNFKAIAKVVIGFSDEDKQIHFFEGAIKGLIVAPTGGQGFGWDPIFQPEGLTKTFAEMSTDAKNKISMRRIAFTKLKDYRQHHVTGKVASI
jgi:non-canonical purine NTP pyrophosphatase (RdgB/HAM1 family)